MSNNSHQFIVVLLLVCIISNVLIRSTTATTSTKIVDYITNTNEDEKNKYMHELSDRFSTTSTTMQVQVQLPRTYTRTRTASTTTNQAVANQDDSDHPKDMKQQQRIRSKTSTRRTLQEKGSDVQKQKQPASYVSGDEKMRIVELMKEIFEDIESTNSSDTTTGSNSTPGKSSISSDDNQINTYIATNNVNETINIRTNDDTSIAEYHCNCPSCTVDQFRRDSGASDYTSTCEERVRWVQQNNVMYPLEVDACKLLAKEFPTTCGVACNPTTCHDTGTSTSTTINAVPEEVPEGDVNDSTSTTNDAADNESSSSGTTTTTTESPNGSSSSVSKVDTSSILGPNVWIIDSSKLSIEEIQGALDDLYYRQVHNEMGTERYTVYFLPGIYGSPSQPLFIKIGYYTQMSGLGKFPTDVTIYGKIEIYNRCFVPDAYKDGQFVPFNGDSGLCFALNNFWRSLSNLSIQIVSVGQDECRSTALFWAISQASSMRRVLINGGDVSLMDYCSRPGYASGGFISDTSITNGKVISGSQQQFFTRNSQVDLWDGAVWNIMFMGTTGAPSGDQYPGVPITTFDTVPSYMREKPFLYIDSSGNYMVHVPSSRKDTAGVSWQNDDGSANTNLWDAGKNIPLDEFLIIDQSTSVQQINQALVDGLHLLFLPNVYDIDTTILITQPNTIILGIGHATITAISGSTPILIANDTPGVVIAGITIDAGDVESRTLLQVGERSVSTSDGGVGESDPIMLIDVYFRLGGPHVGKADISLEINTPNVVIDHAWVWRADHGIENFDRTKGFDGDDERWAINIGRNGLVVNSDNVTAYGLFVEHYQQHNVIWNGNNGNVYFFQCEIPYDPPTQEDWTDTNGNYGWAGYKVSDTVQTHELWGGGIYCYNRNNPSIVTQNGFEYPSTTTSSEQQSNGISMNRIMTRNLSGPGQIIAVINNQGDSATADSPGPHYIVKG